MVGIPKEQVMLLLRKRVSHILLVAEAAIPPSRYQAYRKYVLDEFGRNGMEGELEELNLSGENGERERNGPE